MKKNPAKRRVREIERSLEAIRDGIDDLLEEQKASKRDDEEDDD